MNIQSIYQLYINEVDRIKIYELIKIYHNDKEKDCRKLATTELWIGLSFWYQDEIVEMVEYKYE